MSEEQVQEPVGSPQSAPTYGALAVVDGRVLGFSTGLEAVKSESVPLHCPVFMNAGQLYHLGRLAHAADLFKDRPDLVDPVGQLHKERLQEMWAHLQAQAVSGETAPRAREEKEGRDVAKAKAVKTNGEGKSRAKHAEKVITVLAEKNPKREGTGAFDRFKLYKDGMTVADFIKKGGTSGDVNYDVAHKYIKLANAPA